MFGGTIMRVTMNISVWFDIMEDQLIQNLVS